MVREIIWSKKAQNDRILFFAYWNQRNKSKTYSRKLNKLFVEAAEFLSVHPFTGRITSKKNIRIKFVSNYALIYEPTETDLRILAIFDTRQDPNKLKKIINQ